MTDLICYCFQVSRKEIVEVIVNENLQTVEDVSLRTNACRGCKGCWCDIEDLLQRYSKPSDVGDHE